MLMSFGWDDDESLSGCMSDTNETLEVEFLFYDYNAYTKYDYGDNTQGTYWETNQKWKELFENFRESADMQDLCIDGTYIKAHRASAGAKKGMWTAPVDSILVLVVEDDPPKSMQS